MHSIVLGMHQLPSIVGVTVKDKDGQIIDRIGWVFSDGGQTVYYDQKGREFVRGGSSHLFRHEFPIIYDRGDRKFHLGTVAVYSSSGVVFDRISFGFILLIVVALLQLLAFGILFLWIFWCRLSRPLAELTHVTGQ